MLLIYDLLSLVFGSIGILAGHPKEFAVTLVIAFVLAGLGWYGAANYSKLWNLQLLPFGLIGWAAWRDLKVTV